MPRSKDSSRLERWARASGPVALLSLFVVGLSVWLGRPPPGPLQNVQLPDAPVQTIGAPPDTTRPAPGPSRPAPPPSPSATLGALLIRVEDAGERPRSGVPIRVTGPTSGSLITEANGSVLLEDLEPGTYRAEIGAGCLRDLEIFQGRVGKADVFAGQTSVLLLGGIDARARYWPERPVRWSSAPPWSRGETVTIRFSVFDRCEARAAAAGTSFERLRYAVGETLSLVGAPPTKADPSGEAELRFRCITRGTPSLVLFDPDTDEAQDLLLLTPAHGITPACR